MSVFGVILVCIFPDSDWIRTRITLNTDTFHAVKSFNDMFDGTEVSLAENVVSSQRQIWEPCQTFKMEHFANIINGWKLLTIFAETPFLDVWKVLNMSLVVLIIKPRLLVKFSSLKGVQQNGSIFKRVSLYL